MKLTSLRSKAVLGLVGAVVAAAGASNAKAAMTFSILSDAGDTSTVAATIPVPINSDTKVSPLYGAPAVSGSTTLDFNVTNPGGLSSAFLATASSSLYSATEIQETDGKLVLKLHFDTPISLNASISENGTLSTSGAGFVNATGGGIAIEAVDTIPVETEGSLFAFTPSSSTWTATASVTGFVGLYTDYILTIDNDLVATAPFTLNGPASSATIAKKELTITITGGGGESRPTPEPASIGLLAIGCASLLGRRRR